MKRLFPALAFCVLVVSGLVQLFDPLPHQSLVTGLFALLGAGNLALYQFEVDYFAASSRFNAFTHTWSLGVEEQFYLAFPLLLWFAFFRREGRRVALLGAVVALLSVASLASFLWLYGPANPAAYLLTPMRVWELGAGSLVFLSMRRAGGGRWVAGLDRVSPLVAATLLGCFFLKGGSAAWVTVVAVLATAALLPLSDGSVVARALSRGSAVYLGRISYSLYLWHWPVLVLAPLLLGGWAQSPLLLVGVTGVLSVGSYEWIERPLRYRPWPLPVRGAAWSVGLAAAAGVVWVTTSGAALVTQTAALRDAFPALEPHGLPFNPTCVDDGRNRRIDDSSFDLCTVPPRAGSGMPTLWGLGDSHAGQLLALLYAVRETTGVGVHLIETPDRAFPPPVWDPAGARERVYAEILERVREGDVFVVAREYFERRKFAVPSEDLGRWTAATDRWLAGLAERGVKVVLVGPIPMFRFAGVRECLGGYDLDCSVAREPLAGAVEEVSSGLRALAARHADVVVFEPFPLLCPVGLERCDSRRGGHLLFRDRTHLNRAGAVFLEPAFTGLLERSDWLTARSPAR